MKPKLRIIALAATIALIDTTLAAPTSPRQAITAAYNRAYLAADRRNLGPLKANLAPNYRIAQPNGRSMDRARYLRTVSAWSSVALKTTSRYRITKFASSGNRSLVSLDEKLFFVWREKKKNAVHTLRSSTTADETWVKTKGGWKKELTKIRKTIRTIDGRPF